MALLLTAAPAPAAIFLPGAEGFDGSLTNQGGAPDTQAGSHPYAFAVRFALPTHQVQVPGEGKVRYVADEDIRSLTVELPPGLVVNPAATPTRCTEVQLIAECPASSAVGTVSPDTYFLEGEAKMGLYNMVVPSGAPAMLGFNVAGLGVDVHLLGGLRTGTGYGLFASADNLPQPYSVLGVSTVLWGRPSDPSHDSERGRCADENSNFGSATCPVPYDPTPFLTMPSACSDPLTTAIEADTYQNPGVSERRSFETHDAEGHPVGVGGCGELGFEPSIEAKPTTEEADAPSGLNFDLHLPQSETSERAESTLKDAVVTLPAGLDVNPSAANGLQGCSAAQFGLTSEPGVTPITTTPGPATCPAASKIGSVEVDTPLLEHPLPGAVYLAKQGENPFHSLLAIYIAVHDPETGVVVKLAGHVEPNPETGQLLTTVEENPQLPFEDFKLDFFGGAQGSLRTPATCGHYETTTELTPWSGNPPATPSDPFSLTAGPGGGACANTPAEQPHRPAFSAGTLSPAAGTFSPFVLRLHREDGSQELKSLNVTLPPGLTGKLAGVGECPQAGIEAAEARSHEGEGALERSSPSCPLGSEVGTVTVGAGAGPDPVYVTGHAYLAGPYRGAPLSMAIITPAVTGPFDLGVVVVKTALRVNPETAQITATSDPIPHILDGIPLDVRSVALDVSRNQFTLNPTSCNVMSFTGAALSVLEQSAPLSSRFQVGGCQALPYKPKLAISLKGATHRAGHPALKAVFTAGPGEANTARAQVNLPHSEFLDNAHIGTVCTKVQFAEGGGNGEKCPPTSIYGHAKAETPLLEKPLEGPVYLRSPLPGHKLPDLVAALGGQIDVALVGKVDTGPNKGIRNTFEVVPDAPVSRFTLEMQGAGKGLLENSEDICAKPQRAIVHLTAQNGKLNYTEPLIANSCKKGPKKHRKRARRRAG